MVTLAKNYLFVCHGNKSTSIVTNTKYRIGRTRNVSSEDNRKKEIVFAIKSLENSKTPR